MANIADMRARGQPIAVIGSGCRFPGGANTPSKLWDLLKEPKDLLTKIPKERFNVDAFYHPDGTHHGRTNVQHSYFLSENVQAFDASFFNITPSEADCVDPQHRLLLETVYESLCTAGQKVENLQGSSTAVYVGLMCGDYADVLAHDLDSAPAYTATGSSGCILSNRVSYFFDWHGPSMTIDTACSSSLVAVHQAVQCLRNGDSKVAIAAGANLIFGPLNYVIESSLGMLSPNGRSRMWDAGADGYARGEGVAAVVLKTLDQALQDGDHIECIIRETGVNQDGRSAGITMPSHAMQERLIRDTYAKAGLDLCKSSDRCQYFEAHGTGTPAGDPQEAEAIASAFFGDRARAPDEEHLYVGSVKTVIGHTEGTAGIAGLLKASLAVQNAIIPPNLLFENLSPKVEPFYNDVRILTDARRWPELAAGEPRRASVNSFGFGGTNAHAIIESYDEPEKRNAQIAENGPLLVPIVLSANSERALKATMEGLLHFLIVEPNTNMQNLAWTLMEERSVLSVRRAFAAQTVVATRVALEKEMAAINQKQSLATKSEHKKRKPNILGVFTGQGAQWPAMGKVLIESVPFAREIVKELDHSLATLPSKYRPSWTLIEQLALEGDASNVKDATFSQPLCTAIQIVLVELLTAAGLAFKTVVGHSSGEIACAFAAGYVTAAQAIRIAYLRGWASRLASSPSGFGGSMLAAGTTFDDAMDLCELEMFQGRICLAASNAPDSITLSGDSDAIEQVKVVLEDESKFARLLKVDKAYHSHHMLPCARTYVQALNACGCATENNKRTSDVIWLSSVYSGKHMTPEDVNADYWKANLVSPVLFSQAVELALTKYTPLDAVIEVGCHAALKGPSLSTMQNAIAGELPYIGCMQRETDDIEAFSNALGYLWEHFGAAGMDINAFNALTSPTIKSESMAKLLPQYPWDKQKTYWVNSRSTRAFLSGEAVPHPLLGKLSSHSTASALQWHNFIRPRDIPWLEGHQLQGQAVFPGAAYAIMAMEAAKYIAGDREVQLLEVLDLKIGKAITFDDEHSLVEINLTVDLITEPGNTESIVLRFNCDSCLAKESSLSWSAGGTVVLTCGPHSANVLPTAPEEPAHMTEASVETFYKELDLIGYGYTKEFRGLTNIKRSTGRSSGTISLARFGEGEAPLVLHPATLDVAFQAFIGAFCAPGDGRLRSLHVPVSIARIAVNPWLSAIAHSSSTEVLFSSTISNEDSNSIGGEVEVFIAGSRSSIIQIEQISFKPFSPPTSADDKVLFSKWVWGPLDPDSIFDDPEQRATDEDTEIAYQLERILYFYLRTFLMNLSEEDRLLGAPHIQSYIRWAENLMMAVAEGRHMYHDLSWDADEADDIQQLCEKFQHRADVRLFQRVGEHLADSTREDENVFEVMNHDGLLTEFYEKCLGCPQAYHYLGKLVGQLTHRYPNMDILEIGAGTGGATKHVLKMAGTTFNNFTFTDISSGFFDEAQKVFAQYEDHLDFKSLDITRKVEPQGFKEHSYDMIIASNVLHATPSLKQTLTNVRSLLKPGGHLLFLELTNPRSNRAGFVFGLFPDWWAGENEGRDLAPFVPVEHWNSLLQETGFSSIDTRTADSDADVFALSVFSAHAVDNRMKRLDAPLSLATEESSSDIVVVGGSSGASSTILDDLKKSLLHRHFRVFAGLQDMLDQHVEPHSTFVILSELDSEVFAHLNEDTFEGLKAVFFYAKNIIWLTDDAWTQHPYQAMVIGLLRTIRLENAEINIQSLDIDGIGNFDVDVLVKQVLRLEAERGQIPEGILWTTEPELRYTQGRLFVPRLTPDEPRNNRYNAANRVITATADFTQSAVSFKKTKDECYFESEQTRIRHLPGRVEKVRICVQYSLPQAVRIGNLGYFYLVQGQLLGSEETVLALSESNASSVEVPKHWIKGLGQQVYSKRSVLLQIAAELLADAVLSCVASGASLLVLEPHVIMTEPLMRKTSQVGTKVNFAAVLSPSKSYPADWIKLHEKESVRVLESVLPDRCSSFFDLSHDQCPMSVAHRLTSSLPAFCKRYDSEYLFQDAAVSFCGEEENAIGQLLEDAIAAMSDSQTAIDPISAACIATGAYQVESSTVIDWTEIETVAVRTQPIDSSDLFTNDKTYLLVGLAGDLGRSLCLWMIKHGARHVVLTSRNPKVDPRWIEDMARLGATVKLQSMNVLHRESLISGLAAIQQKMPVVGGIAFGPLVLQDALFENMDLETMQLVLEPKVEGTRHLNDLFFDHDLDFFVMFSSLVMVGGNPGQSNYSAANAYMRTIAAQRRQRGLAASCINIGAIAGVGFLAKAAREEDYSINKYMFTPLAEQDLHAQFAEAVMSGKVDAGGEFEVMTGMPYMDPINRELLPFFEDPRLGQFRLPDQQKKFNAGADLRARPIRERLLEARSMDEAHNAIKDALTGKLRTALAIPSDDSVDTETPLIDQGVDSLVAVAIRTWFAKQLDLDIPVLKVLGGASVIDLVDDAVERLPPSSIPLIQCTDTTQEYALPIASSGVDIESVPTTNENYSDDTSETSITVPSTNLSDDECSQDKLSDVSTPPTASFFLTSVEEMRDPFEAVVLTKKLQDNENLQRTEIMSFGQARFWLMRRLVQDPTTFNVTVGLWMEGFMDIERLKNAVHSAMQRHETFRTRFFEEDGRPDRPMQAIMKDSRVRFENVPVKDRSAALQGFKELQTHLYDIETGDTARIVYFHWSQTEGFLVICYHHIISDGWSYELLFNEIDKLYRGEIPPAPAQYADYAVRQRKHFEAGDMDADIAYWESEYQTLPPVLPLLPLSDASTRLRPVAWDYHEASIRLQPMVAARIRDRSRKHKANAIHFYLAAFQVLLARLSGSNDFSVGLSDANRSTLADLTTMGFFINLLPIRLEYSANQTFGEAIGQARTKVREALLHAKVPFDVLLQRLNIPRASTHAPIFQAGFDYVQGQAESGSIGESVMIGVELSRSRAAMDIMVEVLDDPKRDPKITIKLQSSIYAKEDVQALLKSYFNILATFSRNPALHVEEPRLFARGDVEQAMQLGKGFIMENTWQPTLLARIHNQCNSIPDHTALMSAGVSISYREMAHTINGLASTLIDRGITPGAKIVSIQEPTPTWVCSMLAIMRTGAIYVPIDPSIPQARMSAIIKDCNPAAILINEATIARTVLPGTKHPIINVSDVPRSEAVSECFAAPEQPCAILYTSGTTGTPKGHILSHTSILNNIDGTITMLGSEPLHVLQHSALTFDMSIWQPLLGLASGGYVYVVPSEDRRDSRRISQLIAENDVSCMVATPLEYASWMQVGSDYLAKASGWKYALTGGEALTHAVLHKFHSLSLPQLRVFNSYGPAEICFYSHAIEIAYKDDELPTRVPIGMPMPNYSAYIVDEKLRPVATGWPGEILIGGLGVGMGYLNQPELTANAFIPDTFASAEEKARGFTTLFRSGDRGRLRSDGALLFDGRIDGGTQIKLRGIRIELQDIEACILNAADGILSDAVVGVRGEGAARFLVAHVVFAPAHPADQRADFLRNLRASLAVPNYMRPAVLVELDTLPVGRHAKVDRAAVASMALPSNVGGARSTAALTIREQELWQLWCDVLPEEAIADLTPDADTDFIGVGGNSILIVQLHALLQESIGRRMPLVELFESTTIREMADRVEMLLAAGVSQPHPVGDEAGA